MAARPFSTFTATTASGRTYTQDINDLPEGTVIYVHPEEGTPYEYRLQRDINAHLAWFAYRDGKTVNPNFVSDGATIVRYALQRPKRATITIPTSINAGSTGNKNNTSTTNNASKKEENTMNNQNNGIDAAISIADELLAALARKEAHHALADYASKTAERATKKARAIHYNIRTAAPKTDAPRSTATTGTEEHPTTRRNAGAPGNQGTSSQAANQGRNRDNQAGNNGTPEVPTIARVYNATTGKWENVDIHKLPAGTVLHSGTSSYYRTSDHILTHRVGPWVSDIGSTITSANLAAQIRLQYKGDNAYYTAITPTAMNTLSQ